MLYKLVKITDLDGKDKTDEEVVNRIGRILYLDIGDIKLDRRLFMECTNFDMNGDPI